MAQKTTYTVTFDTGTDDGEVTVTEKSTRTYTHALLVYSAEEVNGYKGWGAISFHGSRELAEKSYSQWSGLYKTHRVVAVQVAN